MKVTREVILKIKISGEDLKLFKSAMEKVLQSEVNSHLGIGILNSDQKKIVESILSEIDG